jgi:transcriptional regulator with XRE-family HTH domain
MYAHEQRLEESNTPMGQFLAERRKQLGISQKEMAERVGMGTPMAWSLIERGVNKLPPKYFVSVARELRCYPGELINCTLNEMRAQLFKIVAPPKRAARRANAR